MSVPDKDATFKFYEYELRRMEFFENQKEKIVSILFTISSALLVISSVDEAFNSTDRAVGLILVFLGLFGIVLSAKNHLASRRYRLRSKAFENLIDEHFGKSVLISQREKANAEIHKIDSQWWAALILSSDRINLLWAALPSTIIVFGLILIFVSS
jgi:hypothetical protein